MRQNIEAATVIRTAGTIRREMKVGVDALRLSLHLTLGLALRSASLRSARARHARPLAAAGDSPAFQSALPAPAAQDAVTRFAKAVAAGKCAWPNVSSASARV